MSDTDYGVWVVRVWQEDDGGTRARITATVPGSAESAAEERVVAVSGVEQIEASLHDFLLSVVSRRRQPDSASS